jgi:hypothetical protein
MASGLRSRFVQLTAIAVLALAGCNQTSAPAPSASVAAAAPTTTGLPEGARCTGEIGRYSSVMENDRQSGQVNASVYERVRVELDQATSACAAGRDAEAVRMVAATKSRYGYR